ncbi:MAG: succinate dehydrogenase [Candidatus Melainabacteria bacterium]|nr:succinate dehydrogenase [Candidatus Melainabacteria bacterium]
MAISVLEKPKNKFALTQRKDFWWFEPLIYFIGLSCFIVYATWAAFQGKYYEYGPYLSPFYSPLIIFDWWKFSPAFLILWIPAGFRLTCYYYRKAYYRSYLMDPPACAVSEGYRKYSGETIFPLILQNIHRYFLLGATALLFFLWHDVIKAFDFNGQFGIGIGTVILFASTFLLTMYSLSCHSFRHLIGGYKDSFKCGCQHKIYKKVSCMNEHHMFWAWTSLFMVGFADFYIRMLAMGVWIDIRIL